MMSTNTYSIPLKFFFVLAVQFRRLFDERLSDRMPLSSSSPPPPGQGKAPPARPSGKGAVAAAAPSPSPPGVSGANSFPSAPAGGRVPLGSDPSFPSLLGGAGRGSTAEVDEGRAASDPDLVILDDDDDDDDDDDGDVAVIDQDVNIGDLDSHMMKSVERRSGPFGQMAEKVATMSKVIASTAQQAFLDGVLNDQGFADEIAGVKERFKKKTLSGAEVAEALVLLFRVLASWLLLAKIAAWRGGDKFLQGFCTKMIAVEGAARIAIDTDVEAIEKGKGTKGIVTYTHGLVPKMLTPGGSNFPICPGCGCHGTLYLLKTWDDVNAENRTIEADNRRALSNYETFGTGRSGEAVSRKPRALPPVENVLQCFCLQRNCGNRRGNRSCEACYLAHEKGQPFPILMDPNGFSLCSCQGCRCKCTTALTVRVSLLRFIV